MVVVRACAEMGREERSGVVGKKSVTYKWENEMVEIQQGLKHAVNSTANSAVRVGTSP